MTSAVSRSSWSGVSVDSTYPRRAIEPFTTAAAEMRAMYGDITCSNRPTRVSSLGSNAPLALAG